MIDLWVIEASIAQPENWEFAGAYETQAVAEWEMKERIRNAAAGWKFRLRKYVPEGEK